MVLTFCFAQNSRLVSAATDLATFWRAKKWQRWLLHGMKTGEMCRNEKCSQKTHVFLSFPSGICSTSLLCSNFFSPKVRVVPAENEREIRHFSNFPTWRLWQLCSWKEAFFWTLRKYFLFRDNCDCHFRLAKAEVGRPKVEISYFPVLRLPKDFRGMNFSYFQNPYYFSFSCSKWVTCFSSFLWKPKNYQLVSSFPDQTKREGENELLF